MRRLACLAALALLAAGSAAGGPRLEAVNEAAPPDAILSSPGVFSCAAAGRRGGIVPCQGWTAYAPWEGNAVSSELPVDPRIVARLRRPSSQGGDADLAVYGSPQEDICFAAVAGAARCTGGKGCSELCAAGWFDEEGRGVLAGLAPLRAASLRVVLDNGTAQESPLAGPTVGAFADRRRVFVLDLGRRGYRRVEARDAAGALVARQPDAS
jgi:hypothetical protein